MSGYVELQAASNFSFLRGASHPGELVAAAAVLGLDAIGICDRNSLAGVVRAWSQARRIAESGVKIRALTGCRLVFADDTPELLVYPTDREAYGRLTRLLTVGQLRSAKGGCHLTWEDFLEAAPGQLVLAIAPDRLAEAFQSQLVKLAGALPDLWLAVARRYGPRDLNRLGKLTGVGAAAGVPLVATNDVLYHGPERRPLQDVLTCVREKKTILTAGFELEANAERHLKSPAEMARLFSRFPGLVERSHEIADRIGFDLGELSYEYPDEPVPAGKSAIQHLRELAWEGAAWRFPGQIPDKVRQAVAKELDLIERLDFANYFLTVHDIVRWARGEGILCQGRGSAANSCVCFCLGVTAVDPTKPDQDLLFARFISESRGEPPDIDVDFEHERREEVMQYIYRRYGRERAAIVATVIHYRPKMAIREVGKVLGLTEDVTAALAGTVWGHWGDGVPDDHIGQAGLDPAAPEIRRATMLAQQLIGFPRHLSQHVGGYVLTKRRLDETVPIGNGAMADRTFIEWDKDDIDELGLMKVDVLALGMLTALKACLVSLGLQDIAEIPQEEAGVYEMLGRADSIGVFQVESRAQMSMLPRMKPKRFYDLVIEVAIVRPGPIQGDMVHPYLRRREGTDAVSYPSPHPDHGPADELEAILKKTLGVPLFQEQAMRIAIEAARFSENDADGLRRSMATFRHYGSVGVFGQRFIEGLVARGYPEDFALRCFKQIEGFGSYGFPESHAISFALLVYASAWVKWKHPDVFLMSLLNAQPMGFYQPSQLVRDAQAHGVSVLAPDVAFSGWDTSLEAGSTGHACRPVRLGLRLVGGLKKAEAEALVASREAGLPMRPMELARSGALSRRGLELLAQADAFRSQGLDRRQALWAVKGLAGEWDAEAEAPLLLRQQVKEAQVELPFMSDPQHVAEDYRTTSLSLKGHPVSFFRKSLAAENILPCSALSTARDRQRLSVAGLVTVRQRPGTAKGVVFLTLEDETGIGNVVVWADTFEAHRLIVMRSAFVVAHGQVQRAGEVTHLVAKSFIDLTERLSELREDGRKITARLRLDGQLIRSRDFH
jgi:error-prone DNA polymerase